MKTGSKYTGQLVIIVLVSMAVYMRALGCGFITDDVFLVQHNPTIRSIANLPSVFTNSLWSALGYTTNFYRPMTFVAHMFNYAIYGLNPWGYHLFNVALHAGMSVTVFLLASEISGRTVRSVAEEPLLSMPFMAAVIFAVDPIHTEAVYWVSCVSEIMCSLFSMLSLLYYIRSTGYGDRHKFNVRYFVSMLFFAAGMLSKETAIVLPMIIIGYDLALGAGIRTRLTAYVPYLAASCIFVVLRRVFGVLNMIDYHADLSAFQSMLNSIVLFNRYLIKLVFPLNLNVRWEFYPVYSLSEIKVMLSLLGLGLFLACMFMCYRKYKAVFFLLLIIIVPLLPVLYIRVIEYPFAERYLYMPSVGFSVLAAMALNAARSRAGMRKIVVAGFVLIVCVFGYSTFTRAAVWKDETGYWTDAVQKNPGDHDALFNLVINYARAGKVDVAVELLRHDFPEMANPAMIYHIYAKDDYTSRNYDAAIRFYNLAIQSDPRNASFYNDLGLAYVQKGLSAKAVDAFRGAHALNPEYPAVRYNMGLALLDMGMINDAITELDAAVRLSPDDADAHNSLGTALARAGMIDGAVHEFGEAVRLRPDSKPFRQNYDNAVRLSQGRS